MNEEFLGQRKDEKVVGIFRKSALTTQKGYWVFIAFLAVGLVPKLIFREASWTTWFLIIAILVGLVYLGYKYVLWYYTVFILTNERLRVIQQKGFFKRRTTDLELSGIASVSVDTPNIFGVIFKYGTLHLQSSVGDMSIFMLKKPEKVCAEIQNTIAESPKVSAKKSDEEKEDEPRGEIIFEDNDERMVI